MGQKPCGVMLEFKSFRGGQLGTSSWVCHLDLWDFGQVLEPLQALIFIAVKWWSWCHGDHGVNADHGALYWGIKYKCMLAVWCLVHARHAGAGIFITVVFCFLCLLRVGSSCLTLTAASGKLIPGQSQLLLDSLDLSFPIRFNLGEVPPIEHLTLG